MLIRRIHSVVFFAGFVLLIQAMSAITAPSLASAQDAALGTQAPESAEAPPPTAPELGELAPLPVLEDPEAIPEPTPPTSTAEVPPIEDPALDPSLDPALDPELETAETSEPAESSETAPTNASVTSAPDYSYDRVPLYKRHIPNWGVELAATIEPNFNFAGISVGDLTGISVQWDYQPTFLQAIGVIGLGPSIGTYSDFKIDTDTDVTNDSNQSDLLSGIWQLGGQVRYQARFFREQILVPMAGYMAEYVSYSFKSGQKGRTLIQGPMFGAWLLLNSLEPSAAGDFYSNFGVSRSYLIAEFRMLSGSDANLTVEGQTLFFGLRIEY